MRAWSVNTPAGTGDWAAPAVRRGAEMEAPHPHTHIIHSIKVLLLL